MVSGGAVGKETPVFILTSLVAAIVDMMFAVIQQYSWTQHKPPSVLFSCSFFSGTMKPSNEGGSKP